jgi:CheY-like chemotaxis protein
MNAPELTRAPSSQRTVLLVEDDDLTRATTAEMLRACGCEVVEADSAETALQPLSLHDISLLMVDVRLPGESGLVFAARAREIRPSVPIIVATGGDLADDSPGGSGPVVLRKPYGFDALQAALREATMRC